MQKRLKVLGMAGILVFASISPLSAARAAGSVTFDTDRELLLELLELDITSSDELYTDPEFVELVNAFGDLNTNIDKTAEDVIAILDSLIVMGAQLQEIDDPRFDQYKMDTAELMEIKAEIDKFKAELENSNETFSYMLYNEIMSIDDYDYSQELGSYPSASDIYAVTGQEVILYGAAHFEQSSHPYSATWTQSAGPKAELYTKDGVWQDHRFFRMPDFTGASVDYVSFDMIVTQNGETSADSVKVYHDPTGHIVVERLYNEILGREADEAGLNYWASELQRGVPMEDVMNAFYNSDEYKNKF